MSLAEAIARSITCWLALAAIAGYAIDGLGFGVRPWAALVVALLVTTGGLAGQRYWRPLRRGHAHRVNRSLISRRGRAS